MNILITGASRGIGAELAKQLSDGSHQLYLLSRNETNLNAIAKECNRQAGKELAFPVVADLDKIDKQIHRIISTIEQRDQHLDVLVNNAGKLINKPFEALRIEEEKNIFDVNYFGPAFLTRKLLPLLRRSSSPSIVNIATMGAVQGSSKFPGLSSYSASKGALATLTECLAEEFKNYNIRVNALAIGAVETEMFREAFPGMQAPVKPEEMAGFFKWFITEGNLRFNGKILPVSDSTP